MCIGFSFYVAYLLLKEEFVIFIREKKFNQTADKGS